MGKHALLSASSSKRWLSCTPSARLEEQFQEVSGGSVYGESYRSILTGRERGKNTKLVFGTVRLDLTKILRRQENG